VCGELLILLENQQFATHRFHRASHRNLMAQRDYFEHQLGTASGFAEPDRDRFAVGVAMRAAYRPAFEITN
jgi:hypothetical protein